MIKSLTDLSLFRAWANRSFVLLWNGQALSRIGDHLYQVALAWCLAQGSTIIPIPSARRPETILDSVRAADLVLTDEELALVDADSQAAFAGAEKVGAFGVKK